MKVYLLPGILGLLSGLTLQWTGFSRAEGVRQALGLRRSYALRSGLYAVGASMAMTALLCWLAVIDVDTIEVLPLSAGVVAGGALLGIAAGLCGATPSAAFALLGGAPGWGVLLETLCTLAGCAAAAWLLPTAWLTPLHSLRPFSDTTLFRVTLDEPFLLGGGFLGQGCAGLLLAVIAMCIPSPRPVIVTDADIAARAEAESPPEEPAANVPDGDTPAEDAPADAPEDGADLPPDSPDPEDAPAETFVALLPGEEPLVVDTALDAPPEEEAEDEPEDEPIP